jgi:hypothetical protein
LENLHLVANNAAAAVNVRGKTLEFRLQDIPFRAREITLQGIRRGAAVALAAAELQSGHDLRTVEPGYPAVEEPDDHEELIDDFAEHAEAVDDITPAEDILSRVFLED